MSKKVWAEATENPSTKSPRAESDEGRGTLRVEPSTVAQFQSLIVVCRFSKQQLKLQMNLRKLSISWIYLEREERWSSLLWSLLKKSCRRSSSVGGSGWFWSVFMELKKTSEDRGDGLLLVDGHHPILLCSLHLKAAVRACRASARVSLRTPRVRRVSTRTNKSNAETFHHVSRRRMSSTLEMSDCHQRHEQTSAPQLTLEMVPDWPALTFDLCPPLCGVCPMNYGNRLGT